MARQAFFSDLVTALHHQVPHRRQQLGRQQGHVVDYRLVFVTRLVIEIAVSQELTYRPVMVRQVVKTVEVVTQSLLQHTQHQNLPQVHSRTSHRTIGLRQNMLVQQCQQPRAQLLVAPDVLKPLQHRRDVVPRLRVDPDFLDRHLPELELRSVDPRGALAERPGRRIELPSRLQRPADGGDRHVRIVLRRWPRLPSTPSWS